jgi:hypothetical protein
MLLYTQTFLKSDAHFANQMKTTVCHAPQLPHWEKKEKRMGKRNIKSTKKRAEKKM